MDRTPTTTGWNLPPWLIAGLFGLALAPLLVDHLLFHPDERHYVDAALNMLDTGDWLTPRTPEGELRLQKPILAYWLTAAGATLFEPSPFSTRILFLLAGAATVWWGWRATMESGSSRAAATLAALLLACHPALILSATRSLPDVLLGLFLTMSLSGFLAIIARGRADWGPLLTASLSGALAILSKGSPAIVFLLYSSAYLAWSESTLVRAEWRRFALALGLCAALGGSWFAVMHQWHGETLATQFIVDQGSPYRFAVNPLQVGGQGLLSLLLLATSFGLVLFPSLRPLWIRRRDVAAHCARPVDRYLLGWIALFLTCAACINHVSLRYLLPAATPAAVLLARLLTELEGPLMRRNLRGLAWVMLSLVPLAGAGYALWRGNAAPLEVAMVVSAVATIAFQLWKQMRFTSLIRSVSVTAFALLALLLIGSWGAVALSGPSFGYQMAAALESRFGPAADGQTLTLVGEVAHATRIRICSGGRIQVRHVAPRDASHQLLDGLVARLDESPAIDTTPNAPVSVPCGFSGIRIGDACQAWRAGQLADYFSAHQRRYLIAPIEPTQASQLAEQPASELRLR